jgi:hypothetical protein
VSDIAVGSVWRPRVVGLDGKPVQSTVEVVAVEGDAYVTYRDTGGGDDAPTHRIMAVQWTDYFEPVF